MTSMDWWTVHDNLVSLAYWMKNNGFEAEDLCYMLEKPWKYDLEYQAMRDDEEVKL